MHVVTGATGRLGEHLVKALLSRGKKVKVLVRNEKEELPRGVAFHVGDITKPETLEGLICPSDTVFHLAGAINESSPEKFFYEVNVLGTENMLNACKGKDVERFVFVSSISVFGIPAELPVEETTPKNPVSKYGKSKMLAEEIVLRKKKTVPFSILRPGMIYGRGFDEGYLPVFKMLEKRSLPLIGSAFIGDGDNRIPVVHVSDVVEALILLSEKEEASGQDFNLMGPDSLTQRGLFSIACKELGVEEPKHSIPLPVVELLVRLAAFLGKTKLSAENLEQLARDRAFDNSKIKKKLDFVPNVGVSEGIKEMVAYYKEQRVMP
jgi:nucleoside-diphosphate-sugar epimerase